jgi:hypothetical protein
VWRNIPNNSWKPSSTLCAMLKGKVDLTVNEVTMYEGCVCRAERIFNFGARWKGFVTATFWPLHPGECRLVHIVRTHESYGTYCEKTRAPRYILWEHTSPTVHIVRTHDPHGTYCENTRAPRYILWEHTTPTVHIVRTHEPHGIYCENTRAPRYILWENTSPTVDPVAVQGNVFTLFGRTFFVQRFIFSKSTNLHLIFIYNIGIIFKMRKSVQQLRLNPSTYGSFFPRQLHNFCLAKIFCLSWTQIFIIMITSGQMMIHFNKILRIYFNIILSYLGISSNCRIFFSFRNKMIISFLLFPFILCVFPRIQSPC